MSTQRSSLNRLLVEGVVILLSILAAFSVDAWWGVHQEREQLRTTLGSLQAGFAEHISLIDARMQVISSDQRRLFDFVRTDPQDAANIHPDSTWLALQSIWRSGSADLNVSFLLEAAEGTKLALLEDSTLDQAVGAWRGAVAAMDRADTQLGFSYREALRALSRHPEVRSDLARPAGVQVEGRVRSTEGRPVFSPGTMRRVREDEEVMALAGAKGFQSKIQLRFLGQLRARAETVHAALRAVQAQ